MNAPMVWKRKIDETDGPGVVRIAVSANDEQVTIEAWDGDNFERAGVLGVEEFDETVAAVAKARKECPDEAIIIDLSEDDIPSLILLDPEEFDEMVAAVARARNRAAERKARKAAPLG
jgi:hypothetical protein